MSKRRAEPLANAAAAKARRVDKGKGRAGCQLRAVYEDAALASKLADAFHHGKDWAHEASGAQVLGAPFPCCQLPNLLEGGFLRALRDEVGELGFARRDNDLYSFWQSEDLNACTQPCITALRSFLYEEWRPWVARVSGVDLNGTVDMSASKYCRGDTLLCHDDELGGRRVAFILYLVPDEWEPADGGTLDLFTADGQGQPTEVVKSVVPTFGTLVFFNPGLVSFHQVAEVLTTDRERIAISGWFHGPDDIERAPRIAADLQTHVEVGAMVTPGSEMLAEWCEWINEDYLEAGAIMAIQEQIEEESNISLPSFLRQEKYDAVLAELTAAEGWVAAYPANQHRFGHLSQAQLQDGCPTARALWLFLTSDGFFKFLHQASELGLVRASGILRRFGCGGYTLLHDQDTQRTTASLAVSLPITACAWSTETGGYTGFLDEIEAENLLTVVPEGNTLSLVYREAKTMAFVKHVNCTAEGRLFELRLDYFEGDEPEGAGSSPRSAEEG